MSSSYRFQLTLKSGRVLLSCHETNSVRIDDRGETLKADFACPEEMAISERGMLYVVDRYHHCVQVFDEVTLQHVGAFGSHGSSAGQLNQPVGIAIGKGRIWVADNENHRVQAFDEVTWAHVSTLGNGFGKAPGQLFCPCGVALYAHPQHGELVIVSEWGGGRIQIFRSETGEVLSIFGGMSHVHHAAVTPQGEIYASEHATGRVKRFHIDGDTHRQFEEGVVSLVMQPTPTFVLKTAVVVEGKKRRRGVKSSI